MQLPRSLNHDDGITLGADYLCFRGNGMSRMLSVYGSNVLWADED